MYWYTWKLTRDISFDKLHETIAHLDSVYRLYVHGRYRVLRHEFLFEVSEDCFYYCLERNNVVVLFGTLKVQSFLLTEVSDCGLVIVVTSLLF